MLDKLYTIVDGLNKRFPQGNDPFQIMTRLLEEAGELAQQVNHFEASGVKAQKHGAPNKMKMAKEVQDVLRCALAIARYYHLEQELDDSIESSFRKLQY